MVIPIVFTMILIVLVEIPIPAYSQDHGLVIVVTFPSLANDIRQLVCSDDHVISIVPPGADPHDYQLSVDDIELLRKADLIVSTGHTPFENRIKDLVVDGEINAVLLETPWIEGVVIKANPATGQPNLHMPIYDPLNYVAFINNVSDTLIQLRPRCSDLYNSRRLMVLQRVIELLSSSPRIYVDAVADKPLVQYAISWLGIRVKYLVVKEHGVPATPSDLEVIEDALARKTVRLVVVTEPATDTVSKQLVELASRYDVPVIHIPSPLSNGTIIDKLEYIVSQIGDPMEYYGLVNTCTSGEEIMPRSYGYIVVGGMVLASIIVFMAYIVARRREEFA